MRGDHLDSDGMVEPCVGGPIHLTQATGPKGAHNFIGAESGSRRQGQAADSSKAQCNSKDG